MQDKHNLTTADLARPRDDMRGRGDERLEGREGAPLADAPVARPADDVRDPGGYAPGDSRVAPQRTERPVPQNAPVALFPAEEASAFHGRWTEIQSGFVDEPRTAVERADSLIAEVMRKLAEGFAGERAALEQQWDRGTDVTTEDLRLTLQRYRAFFDRLLKV